MTDTSSSTPGERLDAAISEVKQAVQELTTQLQPKLQELGAQVQSALDAVNTKIDEVQAAVQERLSQRGNTASQQPAGGTTGGTQPPA